MLKVRLFNMLFKLLWLYLAVVSVISVVLTVYDKAAAKAGRWRVPEATLMTVGLFGGAAAEFIMMKLIRHKTKHKKFMIGLPLEIVLHIAVVALIFYLF